MSNNNLWYSTAKKDALKSLKTTAQGLTSQEAQIRLNQYGPNQLPQKHSKGMFVRFLYQFHNVLIYVLIAACIGTIALGHWIDASVIFGVVIINAIIGFLQEGKAENALKAIQQMLSPNALVIRDNIQITIPAADLVIGDIVLLQSGDKVPADLRLVHCKGLQTQEAVLTGESVAVEKNTHTLKKETVIGDRLNMAFSGTLVTHGQASGVVVSVGEETEIGRISALVSEVEMVTTPLLRQMAQFGKWLTASIMIIALATFLFAVWFRDNTPSEMFLAVVSLAVAAIPEGLPAIMTITLAIGVQRMAKRNAIIRRLPAVETLGSVSVICTDKTGTLTRNEMTVRNIITADSLFEVTGTGYDPRGVISLKNKDIQKEYSAILEEIMLTAILCNDASLKLSSDTSQIQGDPMEAAMLVAAVKAGFNIDNKTSQYPRIDIIPFESEHRFMATLHHTLTGEACIFLKGAPERLLKMCTKQKSINGEQTLDKQYWLDQIDSLANKGQRVLAFAVKNTKNINHDLKKLTFEDVESDMLLLGLFGFIDPPREEAIQAVQDCYNAGIRVKMITGDHGSTACAIAKQVNLINADEALTGEQLDLMEQDELNQRVLEVDVYARVSPEHKLLLVRTLQEHNLIVAMTGDGVNDAPALKRANIGLAMGKSGTEAAKEAAEIVLADDNFSSITQAVAEGRTVYNNLQKSILFILPTSGGEALIILAAIFFGFQQLPLTPVQILWVNMVTTVTLALTLAFEPPESNMMHHPPRNTNKSILSLHLIWRVIFVSFIMMAGAMGLFLWETAQNSSIEHARTVAVNTLVMFEIFYLFNSRYISASIFNWRGLTGNRYVLIAIVSLLVFQLAFTYLQPMQMLFGTTSIEIFVWLKVLLVSSSVLLLVELEKYFMRRKT